MTWANRQHPLEKMIELVAPIPLAAAVAWAGTKVGFSGFEASAAAVAALMAGLAAMRAGWTRAVQEHGFEPAMYVTAENELGELLLEEKDSVLILDDPLVEAPTDSRVVRLFAKPEPTPGELVERISDFLGEGKPQRVTNDLPHDAGTADASTALHAALANIRASLR